MLPAAKVARLDGHGSHGKPGSVGLRFPMMWRSGSYGELVRCLGRLREADRVTWRHVSGRYLESERRAVVLPVRRGRWGARVLVPAGMELAGGLASTTGSTARVVVRIWEPWVDEGIVEAGVHWLARAMYDGRSDRIVVPRDLVA